MKLRSPVWSCVRKKKRKKREWFLHQRLQQSLIWLPTLKVASFLKLLGIVLLCSLHLNFLLNVSTLYTCLIFFFFHLWLWCCHFCFSKLRSSLWIWVIYSFFFFSGLGFHFLVLFFKQFCFDAIWSIFCWCQNIWFSYGPMSIITIIHVFKPIVTVKLKKKIPVNCVFPLTFFFFFTQNSLILMGSGKQKILVICIPFREYVMECFTFLKHLPSKLWLELFTYKFQLK